jgi:cephalosporin hydroxylase
MIERSVIESWPDRDLSRIILEYYDLFGRYTKLGIQQCLDELQQVKDFLGNRKVENFYEIGSDEGGSLWIYSHLFLKPGGKVYSIEVKVKPILRKVVEALTAKGFNIQLVKQASMKFKPPEEIEFLHIDGDHAYNSVRPEFSKYYPLVKENGFLLIHDTLIWDGPIRLREEIEGKYDAVTFQGTLLISEIFGHPTRTSTGITLVRK